VLWGGFAVRSVAANGGDETVFTAFGEASTEITDHAEELLGQDVFVRVNQGHDGKFFFLQALDPLYLQPDEHAVLLDRPVYRGQRMLYPLIAGGFGLMPDHAVPWAMILTNVVAAGLGTAGAARLAVRHGRSPWWGLAFALNLGLFAEFLISGAGVLSFAAIVWAIVMLDEDRIGPAAAWLVAAVLSREVMLLAVGGVALLWWLRRRRVPWLLAGAPAGAVALWGLYLRVRLDEGSGVSEVQEIGWPFGGMIASVSDWMDQPFDMSVALVLVLVSIAMIMQAIRRPSYVSWAGLGFVALGPLLTAQVWTRYFDISRALAPLLTLYVLSAFVVTDGIGTDSTAIAARSTAPDTSA
jgi:hypothetical protein